MGPCTPSYPAFAASAARMPDDDLCAAIGVADAEPEGLRLDTAKRNAFFAAMASEVVRRLAGRRAA